MASMGEGCNIHTDIAAAFSQKGNHHIVVYKGLETALKDPRKNYKDKVGALLRTWEQISAIIPRTNYASYEAKTTFKLMTWTFPRTLRLVLKQEWFSLPKIMKTHLIVTLQRCIDITTRYCQWDHKCELCTMLLGVVKNPWNILMYKEVASPEFLKWCKAEQDLILPLRFEMLIEDGLMDEAINLAEKIFQCLTSNGYTIWGDDSRDFFKSLDLYIFMLYRLGRERDIIDVLRKVPLRGALVVIRRFASKASQPTDTWKEVQQVAELTVSYFLAQAMLQPLGKIGTVLEALMEQWVLIYRNQPESDFRALVRKITQVADGAEQLYLLSRVIKEKLGDEQRVLNIELYIRGITTDMNALEQYKDKEDKEKELETEVRLSEAFLELSEFFKHVIGVRRECVLTAFCLNPTESCFTLIQNIAKESGKISQRNKCDHNFPQSTSNSGAAGELCPQCGQFTGTLLSDRMDRRACTVDALFLLTGKRVTESLNYDVLNAPSQVLDAANLGLSPEICSDLSVVLSSPRYRVLNWVMEWEEMNRICMEYMTNKEEMRCRVRVLNYLKIDYSQYKNWPNSDEEKDEFYGIEKGYEHMLELSNESSVDDCDSENNLQFSDSSFRHGRSRGIRDDSSGSDYSPTPRKKDKSKKKRSRTKSLSLSDLDTGAHDSDGCKREKYTKNDKNDRNAIKSSTRRKNTQKTKNIIVNEDTESINVSPFHAIINEDPEKLKSISPQAMLNEQRNIMNTEEDLKKIGPISPSQTYRKPPPKPFCKQPPQPICSITEESFRKFGPISVEQFYEPYEPDLCVPTEEEDLKKIVVKCSPPRIFSDPKESKRMPRVKKYPEKVYPKNHPQLEKPNFKRNKKQPLKPKIKEVVSDPKVVKSLRDFRPNSKKNIKVQDTSNADDKALYGLSSDQRRNLPYDLDGKNNISLSLPLPRVKSHDCIKYRLNIPGLNTLDMIKPPPSETTVQVVQFPRNTNTPSTSNNPSGNSHHPPKTTHSQNILSSGNSSSGTVGQEHETGSNPSNVPAQPVAPALTSSTAETQTQGTITTAQASNTPVSEQTKPVKLNSQSEVKYLTTTSEVNEILRSTLGEGNLHVYTAPQPPTSMGHSKQNVNSRPEVKCLTSSSEVPEILRSTLTEGVHQVQAVSSASSSHHTTSVPDFAAQSRAKLSTRSDVRYLAPVGGVNEILRTAPIVQKAHSSTAAVTSSLSAGPSVINASLQTNHSRQVNPVNPYPPIVKGVDLKVIANLLNKKAELAARDSQMLQLVCKGRKYQIKPLLCTQTGPRSIAAEHSGASTSITAVPVSSEQQQVIQQTPQQQQQQQQQQHVNQLTSQQQTLQQEPQQEYTPAPSVFEEDFTGFSASVGSSNDDKNSSGQNQKQEMSQIASLPKFQQAFGKTIYNSQASSSGDSGSHSATEESGSPESVDTGSQPSASTVLSKAVQTTNLGSGIPVSHTSTPVPQSEASTSVDISASTLHLASTGSVLSIVGAPRFSVATAVRVAGTGMTVQAIQTSTGVIYMHPETTTLVNATTGAAIPSKKKQMASSFDINPAKRKSQSSESVQQTQLPENSVAVAIATPFMPVLSRETAKRSRMLAAALQSPQRSGSLTSTASQDTSTSSLQDPEVCIVESSSDEETTNLMQQTTLTAVPKAVARQVVSTGRQQRPVLHIAGTGNIIPRPANSNIIQSLIHQTVQSVLISPGPSSSSSSVQPRMSQNVGTSDTLIPRPIDPSVSSTTLEQLREFESVLEQVTNTSQMKERNTAQPQTQQQQSRQQHTVLCQQLLITQASTSTTSTAMEFTSCTTGTQSPSFSQDLFPVATTTSATSRVNVTYVSQGSAVRTTNIVPAASVAGKITSPVVVVTSYCQPVASPALSVTSQSSSSPCVTPAPAASSAASAKSPPKSSKSSKSKSVKSSTATTTSKASPVPKPQQKPQEDEQTAQRIYAILGEYAEQLRNSPDLNNKPAPRRRSHPPTNSTQSAKRKKASHTKVKLLGQQSSSSAQEMSPGTDDHRTMGSEDSSSGITQLSHIQDSPGPSSLTPDEHLSLRATPSLDLGTEAGNLRSVVSDSIDMRDVSRQDQSQDQNSHSHEAEQSESQQSPLQLQQTAQHGLLFTEGRTVIVQDNVPSSVDANVTGSATVVTGKPVMVGNSTAVPALFAGVRQVIVPVGHGLTASVQARPVVVANSKGSKVIRVHQVTVPGGSLQMAPGTMQGAALVVRQINKPGIPMGTVTTPVTVSGMPTVKQVKLPVGSISSQALTGVTAQPPVVLPPGSHHLAGQVGSVVTSTIAQALAFPESAIESVLQEGTVRTESSNVTTSGERLLLNTATASQTINFIRRGIQTSFHERISTSGTSTVSTNTPASVSGTVSVNRLTDQTVRQISTVSTDSEVSTSSSTKTECSGISITKSNASIKTEEVKTKDCAKTPNLSTSCQSFQSQLVEASSAAEQSIDTTVFETTGTSAGCTNTLMDYLHSHQIDRSHQSDGGSSSTGTDNENQNSPWRFETQQAGSSRQIPDRDVAEIENLQERRSFLSDARTKTTNALNDTPNKEESDKTSVRIERLIKFKSLSEECEDLGVDEPSTRELFPEADLLLDQNSSRSGGDNISAIEDTTMVTIPSPVSPSGDTGETSDDQPSLTVDKITYTYGKRPCGDASRAAKRAQLNRARGATTPTPESTTLCRKRTASECEVLLENNEQDMSKPKRRKLTPSSLLPSPEVEDIECSHKTPTRASRRRGNKKNCTCCATPTSGKKQPEKKKALKSHAFICSRKKSQSQKLKDEENYL